MKVIPNNQTLILANERPSLSGPSAKMLDQALDYSASGSTLQRVTIVATQPDTSLLYVQADYFASAQRQNDPAQHPAAMPSDTDSDSVAQRNAALVLSSRLMVGSRQSLVASTENRDGTAIQPSTNPGIALYARTQSMSINALSHPRVDVLA